MAWSYQKDTRHKVFISYYHDDDQYYRNRFEQLFGYLFISKSVEPGDINTDVSTEYIKCLIKENYISDSSIILVLVGKRTWGRKHVDWEISAGLDRRVGEHYAGLLGLCLPTHPDYSSDKFNPAIVPPRLVDNIHSGYAKFYNWTESESSIKNWIEDAFEARVSRADKIDNSRLQFDNNRS
jgi:hypothetical protein